MKFDVSARLPSLYLGFLECMRDPDRVGLLISIVGGWLADEPAKSALAQLEQYSGEVLITLEHVDTGLWPSNKHKMNINIEPICELDSKIVSQKISDKLRAEDLTKVRDTLSAGKRNQPYRFAVQVYDADDEPSKLGIVEFHENQYVLKTHSASISDLAKTVLKRDLGLTDAELDVLSELLLGHSLKAVAQTRGRSIETIRNQVKAVSQKIGVSSQRDIVRSAMELNGLLESSRIIGPTESIAEIGAKSVRADDGRRIKYNVYGHPNGYPLLYFHCMISGRHWPKRAQEILKNRNYKVISMSRAGYGGSDTSLMKGQRLLELHCSDYRRVLREENATKCGVLSYSTGIAIAYSFCLRYPDLTSQVVALDPVLPITSTRNALHLKRGLRTGALCALHAPGTFKLMAHFATAKVKSEKFSLSAPDLAPDLNMEEAEDEDGIETSRKNARGVAQNGSKTLWCEATLLTSDWTLNKQKLNTRPQVAIVWSRNSPFVSKEGVDLLAQQLSAKTVVVPTIVPFLTGQVDAMLDMLQQK